MGRQPDVSDSGSVSSTILSTISASDTHLDFVAPSGASLNILIAMGVQAPDGTDCWVSGFGIGQR